MFRQISDVSKAIDAELTRHVTAEEFAMLDDVLHRLENASAGMLARGLAGLGSSNVACSARFVRIELTDVRHAREQRKLAAILV